MHKIKSILIFLLLLLLLFLFLTNAKATVACAVNGLNTWFQNMIPTLFPFMVLGGLMLRCGYSVKLVKFIKPLLYPLFHMSEDCLYILVMGFLCGFPMGAVLIEQSMQLSKISKEEAQYLVSFCNNIGPVYFIGFVLINCPVGQNVLCICMMYLIPLFYGIILRYTRYRNSFLEHKSACKTQVMAIGEAFEQSLNAGISSITKLGGYMILFNALTILFHNSMITFSPAVTGILSCVFEISGGILQIQKIGNLYPFVYSILPIGGFCCLAQTYGILHKNGLSMKQYVFHKGIQTIFTGILYYGFFLKNVFS